MRSRAAAAALALCLLASPAPAGPHWLRATGAHIQLYSTSERDSVQRLAAGLELMADLLSRSGLGTRGAASIRTTIVAFPERKQLVPHVPVVNGKKLELAGYVVHLPFGNWIGYDENDPRGRMVAHHEFMHTITNQIFHHVPLALNEGLAEYFATFAIVPGGVEFGHAIPWWRYVVQSSELLPLDDLLAVDHTALSAMRGDGGDVFYAESWALVDYLLRHDVSGATFFRFVRDLADGQPPRASFEHSYPSEDWDKLPGRLKAYMDTDVEQAHVLNVSAPLAGVPLALEEASTAEVTSQIALWRLFEADVDAQDTKHLLDVAERLEPGQPFAQAGLGHWLLRAGSREDALVRFRRVSADSAAPPLAEAIAGAGIVQLAASNAQSPDAALLREARDLLARSVLKDSTDAMALGWYGRASLALNEVDEHVLKALERASNANPEDASLAQAFSVALGAAGHEEDAQVVASSHPALARDRDATRATQEILARLSIRDSLNAALQAHRMGDAMAMLDRYERQTSDGHERSAIASARTELQAVAREDSAESEYDAGRRAAESADYAGARDHFALAARLSGEEEIRSSARLLASQMDSAFTYTRARRKLMDAVEAGRRGDPRAAKADFDSAARWTSDPRMRADAERGAADCGALLDYQLGLAALKHSAWAEAARCFARADAEARSPELKAQCAKAADEARRLAGGRKK